MKCGVLIEPLWNWNYRLFEIAEAYISSNWTFMELKRSKPARVSETSPQVLIEPLWNWNFIHIIAKISRTVVLIEPLWNWNRVIATCVPALTIRSNWTFMELKRLNCTLGTGCPKVLIEPLWNWNSLKLQKKFGVIFRSNWTFMELKLGKEEGKKNIRQF